MASSRPRIRLSREDRYHQLVGVAWEILREEGAEALTLGYLAECAGVTKPVVYDHFVTRSGLLAVLYQDYDQRHNVLMDAELAQSGHQLIDKAAVIANSYVECVLNQGREISGIVSALNGTPELEKIKCEYECSFIEKCRGILSPYVKQGEISNAGLWAMLGAAESLSNAAVRQQISAEEAKNELVDMILGLVGRASGE